MLIHKFAKLNRSSRSAASAALIIIVAVAVYNRIVVPHTVCLFAANRHERVLENIAEKNKVITAMVQGRREKLQELVEQFTRLQGTLFTADKAKEFFSDLEPISEEADCAVYSLNFGQAKLDLKDKKTEATSGIVAKSAMLSVIGAYKNIIRLVERLQARSQKVWMDSLDIQHISGEFTQLKCDITITIHIIQDKETTVYE